MKNQELEKLANQIFKCDKCSRLLNVTSIPYPHIFYGDAEKLDIFVLMRNPGLENKPINGNITKFIEEFPKLWYECKVGSYLRQTLGEDVVNNRMFFANLCKCSSPNNSPLDQQEINHCLPYLRKQIEIVKPKVILSFGADNNKLIESIAGDIPYYKFYHPSYFSYVETKIKERQYQTIKGVMRAYV